MKKLLSLLIVAVFMGMGIGTAYAAEHPAMAEPTAKMAGVEACAICAAGECSACAAKDYQVSQKKEEALSETEDKVRSQIKAVKKSAASKKPKDHPAH
jgi:hypothetical protein